MLSNDALCRCQSSTFNPELRESVTPRLGLTEAIRTSRSGSRYGSGRSNTALTTLKMAVFATMPSASVSTATAVKPGFFSNWRKANLRSFITQRLHRIDSACSPGRPPASEDRYNQERSSSQKEHRRIPRRNTEQKTLYQPCPTQGQ